MKRDFIERVIRERVVDTRKYRYTIKERQTVTEQYAEIRRLPLSDLDTTAAIDGWETVKVIGKTYYFPNAEQAEAFFGSQDPICVDYRELARLATEWDLTIEELMDQVHEATDNEIETYGTYDY